MKYIYVTIFLFSFFTVFAQNGFSLNFKNENSEKKSVVISLYNGTTSKFYSLDTLNILPDKEEIFAVKNKVLGGIYRLNFTNAQQNDFINISVENEDELNFKIPSKNIAEITAEDDRNTAFLKIQQNTATQVEKLNFYTHIINAEPETALALFAKMERKRKAKIPTSNEELHNYRDQYFSDIDLNDKRIKILPNVYAYLFAYVKILPINAKNYSKNIDLLLQNQNCNSKNYMFYLKWVFMNLAYFEKYQLNDSYKHIFNTYLNKMECIEANKRFYNQIYQKYINLEVAKLHSKIPEFSMEDEEENMFSISEIYSKHQYTFIAFYDPHCDHCIKKMPLINAYFETLKKENPNLDIQQIAFLNAYSTNSWKEFINDHNLNNWLNVKTIDTNYSYMEDLNVASNPNFFLVDKTGKIISKKFNESQLNTIFNTY